MTSPLSDTSLYTARGVFYPRGQVFAMLPDATARGRAAPCRERAARHRRRAGGGGRGHHAQRFTQRAEEVGGAPSVGREDQFMLRFVELARQGLCGLLIELGEADARTPWPRHCRPSARRWPTTTARW